MRQPLLIVSLMFLVVMIDGFDMQALGFVAPEMVRDWHVSLVTFGPVFSAALFGSIVGALSAGSVAQLLGLRGALIAMLVTFGLPTLGLVWIQNGQFPLFVGLRLVAGLGLGGALPVAMAIVAEHTTPRFRSRFPTLALCGQPVGAIGGAALCAYYIPHFGWPFAFYLGGIGPLMLALATMVMVPAGASRPAEVVRAVTPAGAGDNRLSGFFELFREPWLATTLLLAACVFFANFFIYLSVNYVPGLVREQGHSLQQSVWAISLFNVGGIVGSLIIATCVDRFGWKKTLPVMFVFASMAFALLDYSRTDYDMFLVVTLFCGLIGYGSAVFLGPLALLLFPASLRAQGTGCVLGLGRLGGASGPLIASFALLSGLSIGRLFYGAAVAALLIMMSLMFLRGLSRPAGVQAT